MPSKSPEQHRIMEAVAHDPGFARKVGIPESVGEDFANADKRRADNDPASKNSDSVSGSIEAYMRAVTRGDAAGIAAIPWATHHGDG